MDERTSYLPDAERYSAANRKRHRRRKVMTFLAAIVVFCTTYALILPAITMERGCKLEEHTHTDACYTQVTTTTQRTLTCADGLHRHTDACYAADGTLQCGCADFVLHTHDASCYSESGALICPLPEITAHRHTDGCYALPAAHTHDEHCYARTRGELLCTDEECAGHTHSDGCYDADGALVCTEEERTGHTHGDACYAWTDALICTLSTESDESATPELICTREEIIPHEHDASCYDESGALTCPLLEVRTHRHTEQCFTTRELPADTTTLTCTNGDDAHIHTARCFGTWVLSCGMEEHTHTADCTAPKDEALPAYLCGQEEHLHGEGCYDANGALLCTVSEHSHTDACLLPPEENEEPPAYLCGQEEHLHSAGCYDANGTLICTANEHSHTDACLLPPEEPPAYVCGREEHTHGAACYDANGALLCGADAHIHTDTCLTTALPTAEEQAENEAAFAAELEALSALERWTAEAKDEAEALLERLNTAHGLGQVSDAAYLALSAQAEALLENEPVVAEVAEGDNWKLLRDSGWFEEYGDYGFCYPYGEDYGISLMSDYGIAPLSNYENVTQLLTEESAEANDITASHASSTQIDYYGGLTEDPDNDGVKISKTIAGTDTENVFDITLQVQTPQKNVEIVRDPDMAVVIVMDISNTMNSNFGGVTRYAAAMDAAEDFLDKFAESSVAGISKVGYVAFNTDAHKIFDLQVCQTQDQLGAIKNTMRTATGNIINNYEKDSNGNPTDRKRFTNIEAGLKMAQDMLKGVNNQHKFIIFLSDGFPTTYIQNGYIGYDTYDTSGTIFKDRVTGKPCMYGTSYSDEAAIRARMMATTIKDGGTKIFSIGVDVAGQKLQTYIDQGYKDDGTPKDFSVVDRSKITYEIGGTDAGHFANWLKNSIGSGYYYESTNTAGLKDAYDQIFETIKQQVMVGSKADWVATDPLPPQNTEQVKELEFIGLYDKNGTLHEYTLKGEYAAGKENSATFVTEDQHISWDLKNSGYTLDTVTTGSETVNIITYELKYRVRLKTEYEGIEIADFFEEGTAYQTNGTTTMQYRVVRTENNVTVISNEKVLEFKIPKVHGYLGELTFKKVDSRGNSLAGAEFKLTHDAHCNACRGNVGQVLDDDKGTVTAGEKATVADMKDFERIATSGDDGTVTFDRLPSGHTYVLTETKAPDGYVKTGNTFYVKVAYDEVTVTARDSTNKEIPDFEWNSKIVNTVYYELPSTGGCGTQGYYIAGTALLLAAGLLYGTSKRRKGAREAD